MKQTLLLMLTLLLTVTGAIAAESHVLEFKIKGGGTKLSAASKKTMEDNAVRLLTMMSDAQARNSQSLNFGGIAISEKAKNTILQMWKYQPLRVWTDDEDVPPLINEDLLNISAVNSYQIRNIPVRLFPRETTGKDKYSEVAINFSPTGTIEDFNITIERTQYDQIMREAITVQDLENRKMLAFWMDQLKMAYESKDLNYLNGLFDKDALIITGVRTSHRTGTEVKFASLETYDYYVNNKTQYLSKLNKIFHNNKEIRVNFKDQEYGSNSTATVIDRYGEEMPRYYMVWCTQDWMATRYSDTGRLFVLWDFKIPEKPVILVRAWTHPDDPRQFRYEDFDLNED